ncbi:MAG TPA: hypothetical protein PLV21_12515 [Cyclobacteriaceae bacterium]|nr:hypothetical protein [Cyclobacteriaceae bacterium]HRJ82706.1 hypothetical protein [Cyclobacteriaceae bacterium]
MKTLSLEKMEKVEGGVNCDDGFVQMAAVLSSSIGVAAVFMGPVGWAGALAWGAVGLYLGTQVCGAK